MKKWQTADHNNTATTRPRRTALWVLIAAGFGLWNWGPSLAHWIGWQVNGMTPLAAAMHTRQPVPASKQRHWLAEGLHHPLPPPIEVGQYHWTGPLIRILNQRASSHARWVVEVFTVATLMSNPMLQEGLATPSLAATIRGSAAAIRQKTVEIAIKGQVYSVTARRLIPLIHQPKGTQLGWRHGELWGKSSCGDMATGSGSIRRDRAIPPRAVGSSPVSCHS